MVACFVGVSVVGFEQPARICETMLAIEGSVGIDTDSVFGVRDSARGVGERGDDVARDRLRGLWDGGFADEVLIVVGHEHERRLPFP